MRLHQYRLDKVNLQGSAKVKSDTYCCSMQADWMTEHGNPIIENTHYYGTDFGDFGFCPVDKELYTMDIQAAEVNGNVIVNSQGYKNTSPTFMPYIRTTRYFLDHPEMIYEVIDTYHLPEKRFVFSGIQGCFKTGDRLESIDYFYNGIHVNYQFSPAPVYGHALSESQWECQFDSSHIEVLVQWTDCDNFDFLNFESIRDDVSIVKVMSKDQERIYNLHDKHDCILPGEKLVLPAGEVISNGVLHKQDGKAVVKKGLSDLLVRQVCNNTVRLGHGKLFKLDRMADDSVHPMFNGYLVRTLRSLCERIVFSVVTEDDPTQYYLWGTQTWTRCYTLLSLDMFGFTEEAFSFLQYCIHNSKRAFAWDGIAHLTEAMKVRGELIGARDLNGCGIKMFEVGKMYLNHRNDEIGAYIRSKYDILRDWCIWVEKWTNADGLIFDDTESNVWSTGFGVFSQAPCIAGLQLFLTIFRDCEKTADVVRFSDLIQKLMQGMQNHLFGNAGNPYLGYSPDMGECYTTYIPYEAPDDRKRIGLSCYSLAVGYFLQDPDVALLSPSDEKVMQTLRLVMEKTGDFRNEGIPSWHTQIMPHMGYGISQLMASLIHAGMYDVYEKYLEILFDVSQKEVGDAFLMPEVYGRFGNPNRGNKAHCTYFPLIAYEIAHSGMDQNVKWVQE